MNPVSLVVELVIKFIENSLRQYLPIDRPKTNSPFKHPFCTSSAASSMLNAPQDRSISTKHTAMHPSTLRIRFAFFFVVTKVYNKVVREDGRNISTLQGAQTHLVQQREQT
jgi:hypothetical protein